MFQVRESHATISVYRVRIIDFLKIGSKLEGKIPDIAEKSAHRLLLTAVYLGTENRYVYFLALPSLLVWHAFFESIFPI